MRNKYPGVCYRCKTQVGAGEGHFERHAGGWRTQHAQCAIEARLSKLAGTTPSLTGGIHQLCLACGEHHIGMSNMPCPKMRPSS